MAPPTIRTVASYSTHQDDSVDFFGNELIVTVTPTPSVISRWINDVLVNHHRRPYSSDPLVVGVGVQWTPVHYNYTNPHNYYGGSPPGDYYDDLPPGSYYDDLPPGDYYDDLPPGSYYGDPPPDSYYDEAFSADSRPNRNDVVDPPPDTLQLCVGQRCLIIQLSHCDRVPGNLRSFLAHPETTYVGVWNHQDAGKLERSRHGLQIRNLLDIRNYVQDSEGRSMRTCSFEKIVEECMGCQGVRLDPEISRSDWSVYDLRHDQILQASLDVYVCSELGVRARLWEV